jgi:hypothetical protein
MPYRADHKVTREWRAFLDHRALHRALGGELEHWDIREYSDPAWGLPAELLPDDMGRPHTHPDHTPPKRRRH